ncbi:uncharacterized protein PITG_18307 [Phytophthora infestans T30-4]|uniref:Uncharacterized protein n=1 Tax=Phytophthora infestans (strain T30-4) TaxID=403677 RepID=D0NXU9_PHYIT|nr:uncharacterized protein PITG_18307 [Phytophthora infestans T30-4]EEY67900.1 hypothetical protein PITG_18307 [Phytophthora infestans T30-4]|eukprot:XP_002997762.1 hypothetical protein PITG_18307 [Phytophthora infestans T30-4]
MPSKLFHVRGLLYKFLALLRNLQGDGAYLEEVQRSKLMYYTIEAALSVIDLHEDSSDEEEEASLKEEEKGSWCQMWNGIRQHGIPEPNINLPEAFCRPYVLTSGPTKMGRPPRITSETTF